MVALHPDQVSEIQEAGPVLGPLLEKIFTYGLGNDSNTCYAVFSLSDQELRETPENRKYFGDWVFASYPHDRGYQMVFTRFNAFVDSDHQPYRLEIDETDLAEQGESHELAEFVRSVCSYGRWASPTNA